MATKNWSKSFTILYKKTFLALLFSLLAYLLFFQLHNDNLHIQIDPSSNKNEYLHRLNLVLNTANINPSQLILRDFQNEVEFLLVDNNHTSKVILSTQKDPYQQIASLQQILKIAKISDKHVKFIDLSIGRPYATL